MYNTKTEVINFIQKNNGNINPHLKDFDPSSKLPTTRRKKITLIKKAADSWEDNNGFIVSGWETESYMRATKLKGTFMNKVIQELFYIYIESNNNQDTFNSLVNSSMANYELYLYFIICKIINIKENTLVFKPNFFDKSRKFIRDKFTILTKDEFFWDELEYSLDQYTSSVNNQNALIKIKNMLEFAIEKSKISDKKEYAKTLSKIK